jgi:hypothetical protein
MRLWLALLGEGWSSDTLYAGLHLVYDAGLHLVYVLPIGATTPTGA